MNRKTSSSVFDFSIIRPALIEALFKLDPRVQWKTPVMFIVYLGALVTSAVTLFHFSSFNLQLSLWLWFTVVFANLAEALAEGRGKAQADALRAMRTTVMAHRLNSSGEAELVSAATLRLNDLVLCSAGDVIPGDGEVVEGIASVDESAITGESAPVIRESGGDRSAVTGGTRVISDCIRIRITAEPGNAFIDRMIAMVEGSSRQKTPNEIALGILLISMTVLFLLAVTTLPAFIHYSIPAGHSDHGAELPITALIALLVCLIPTTIGGLLSAIGISGIDRLVRNNVLATSGRAVEAAGDIDVLLLDKTGTITTGNRMASEFHPAPGISLETLGDASRIASLADETPEGRSIVSLANQRSLVTNDVPGLDCSEFVPFSAHTRMSGLDFKNSDGQIIRSVRKGAADSIKSHVLMLGGVYPQETEQQVKKVSMRGATPLVVCDGLSVLGVIELKDVIKPGIAERFARLRQMGIQTVMITGDNPLTAAAIAAESGVDDFMAQATPEDKLQRIRKEQGSGKLVAMTGDGTNDAPALAQADVGVAMGSGTQAAREAGNMVDLDSDPTKLIEIVEIGKQLLMTRGALTTFSIANDVAKYFAILPAMFGTLYLAAGSSKGPLEAMNVMRLHSPDSAILSAVIFNALIIIALIPLALSGVKYRPMGASQVLTRNLLIYGLGGILSPFVGIKVIDILLVTLRLV
jgi:K+-transporting ATPase ATPase B chain